MVAAEEISGLFPAMVARFIPEKAQNLQAVILFDLSGDNGGEFWIKVADGEATWGEGTVNDPAMTVKTAAEDWYAVAIGELNPMQAFMTGRIKILGDMGLAMKMQTMFAR